MSKRCDHYRNELNQLLKLRKDKRWRKGFIQAAVMFDIITQAEWEFLNQQIDNMAIAPGVPTARLLEFLRL